MNTDNMAISGETIDYGPCAFMDAYDPATVFSSIDAQGRYAYGNQPAIAQWNLARFAEALLPLFGADRAQAIEPANGVDRPLRGRASSQHWLAGMRAKLGLFGEEADDVGLIDGLLAWMQSARADFTNTFRLLGTLAGADALAASDSGFAAWHAEWRRRLAQQPQTPGEAEALMRRHSPAVIPRNHKVEEALTAAVDAGDLGPLERLMAVLRAPYDDSRLSAEFTSPPPADAGPYRTFCGT